MDSTVSEDDTFRVLSRRPIAEVYKIILQEIVLGHAWGGQEFHKLLQSHGYTLAEYLEYSNG